jgi:hypothetical protein
MNTLFYRRHYEWLVDNVGPLLSTPTDAERLADLFEEDNPAFKRGVFVSRMIDKWEETNLSEEEMECQSHGDF